MRNSIRVNEELATNELLNPCYAKYGQAKPGHICGLNPPPEPKAQAGQKRPIIKEIRQSSTGQFNQVLIIINYNLLGSNGHFMKFTGH